MKSIGAASSGLVKSIRAGRDVPAYRPIVDTGRFAQRPTGLPAYRPARLQAYLPIGLSELSFNI
jgi:hypothetical protein